MKITQIILTEALISTLKAKDKNAVIYELSEAISKSQPSLSSDKIAKVLLERENLGSTGIGSGVAIPHGKLAELDTIVASFGRSIEGIDFDSQDGEPAHLFFVMLAPKDSAGTHLQALAKLSRLLKSSQFRGQLLQAQSPEEILEIIKTADEQD